MLSRAVELIVDQQQHYLIALKANQPTLYQTLAALHQAGNPLTVAETVSGFPQPDGSSSSLGLCRPTPFATAVGRVENPNLGGALGCAGAKALSGTGRLH